MTHVALRPVSNFSLEACLEAVSLRQLRRKIQAREHSYQLFQVQPCWDFNNSIIVSSPHGLRFVLMSICFASEAWPRPGLPSRLRLWKYGTSVIIPERERCCHDQDKEVQGACSRLVLGSFLAPGTAMIFGRVRGLPCTFIRLGVNYLDFYSVN